MAKVVKGSPQARARARLAAAARWGRRTAEDVAFVEKSSPALFRGPARGAERDPLADEAARDMVYRAQVEALARHDRQEREAAQQAQCSSSAASSSSPAASESSGFGKGVAGPLGLGGDKFSAVATVGEAEAPGSAQTDDRPAGEAGISPPVQPAPRVTGPALRCAFCWLIVAAAGQGTHGKECPGSLQMHEAFKWRPI